MSKHLPWKESNAIMNRLIKAVVIRLARGVEEITEASEIQ